jgi:DNA-binding Xre family transcriptional regulator
MMRWKLRELLGEYQQATGERLTYEEITAATEISPNTLSIIGTNKAKRADLDTVERLLSFLSGKLGRQLDTSDLLTWLPEVYVIISKA